MEQAAILGTGLIGASVGLALRAQGWRTIGWDPDASTLQTAAGREAVEEAPDVTRAVDGSDLVVLAGPLPANLQLLESIATAGLVTDVTSVKRAIVDAAPESLRFVGGHPMAGREHAGPAAASAALFRGAPWIICTDHAAPSDVTQVEAMVRSVGANPVQMTAAAHDEVVALISHLPHLLASALVHLAAGSPEAADLVSGSFRDLTRVAAAQAGWWPEVLAANADEVGVAIHKLTDRLAELESFLQERDHLSIRAALSSARESRSLMAPALRRVQVVLQDQPGELAGVGKALEASQVDVRDLQLRHAEFGGGGILTITVRPGEAEPLTLALREQGFTVE